MMNYLAFEGGAGFAGFECLHSYIEPPEKIYEWKPGEVIYGMIGQ